MLTSLSLRTRLLLPPATVFALLLLMAGIATKAQFDARDQLASQRAAMQQSVEATLNLRIDIESKVSALYQSLTWEAVGFEAAQIKKLDGELQTGLARLPERIQARLSAEGLGDEERQVLGAMLKPLATLTQSVKDTQDMKSSSQGLALAAMTLSGAEAAAADLSRSLAKLEQLSQASAEQAALAAGAKLQRATTITLALVLAALVVGGLLMLAGYRSVRRPMAELELALQTLGNGDLASPIHTQQRDEIGALIQTAETLRLRLRDLVGRVAQASATVGRAADEIAAGTKDLSARTEHQASALQEAAASMEQINSTVHNNSGTAMEAGRMASEAARVAERGSAMVGEVIASMGAISGQSRRIAEITSVIDGIAFQTNILALNAAVEAARAGEQGRGFAVVAAEVRTLAQRSATAAREIKDLINESVQNVDRGAELVDSAGRTIAQMVQEFSRVNSTIQVISTATHEQSSGVGQVSDSVNELDRMTQQNAALVEQSAAAAQVLSQQASQLQQALSVFRLEQGGVPA